MQPVPANNSLCIIYTRMVQNCTINPEKQIMDLPAVPANIGINVFEWGFLSWYSFTERFPWVHSPGLWYMPNLLSQHNIRCLIVYVQNILVEITHHLNPCIQKRKLQLLTILAWSFIKIMISTGSFNTPSCPPLVLPAWLSFHWPADLSALLCEDWILSRCFVTFLPKGRIIRTITTSPRPKYSNFNMTSKHQTP